MKTRRVIFGALLLGSLFMTTVAQNAVGGYESMVNGFKNPSESTKPGVYWYWMNEHVSKEGITADLEALQKVGIGEVFIGNIYEGGIPGKVKTLSDEWMECMRHAIREGRRLGVSVSMFNSPGWSQSGGPWVKPEDAMRYLDYTETVIDGGKNKTITLKKPGENFQQVAVLAFPLKEKTAEIKNVQVAPAKVTDINNLWDGNRKTNAVFSNASRDGITIDVDCAKEFEAHSLLVYPTGIGFNTTCEFYAYVNGQYELVKKEFFDRSNTSRQLGPLPDGKMVMSFKKVKAKKFRIKLDNLPEKFSLGEIAISDAVKVDKVTEKSLQKLSNTPNPSWSAYHWDTDEALKGEKGFDANNVINITDKVNGDVLTWKAPKGTKWKIIRIGMLPTLTTNTPAAPAARGLEIDKLSREVTKKHFEAFVGKVLEGLSDDDKKAVKRVIVDSYEVGPQNWSDNFRERFIEKMGYDPLPYLPVMTGEVVGTTEISDRFLWDMRRTIADLIAEEYVGGLKEAAHSYGYKIWLENYGHWGFPSEFLYYGSKSDDIGGEFWASGSPWRECKMAASACHIYGKNEVYAESYTAGGYNYKWNPAMLRKLGDWSYTEGVNRVIMHVYIHQPYTDKLPGVNAWFGIEFNRHNTWFEKSKAWIDYQRRSCYLLQQGRPVRDVCYFVGEDAPMMNFWLDEELDKGYSYDFINSDAIINRLEVKDGKFVLPEGITYSVLVIPPLKAMRPEVLKKIETLVRAGGVVVGKAPEMSPSLKNYPAADAEVKDIAAELFPAQGSKEKTVGAGKVYSDMPINTVLERMNVEKDLTCTSANDLKWIHRTTSSGDIYFVTNQGEKDFEGNVEMRVGNKKPELWNAMHATIESVKSFNTTADKTTVPMRLKAGESVFVVLDKYSANVSGALEIEANYPESEKLMDITSPWDVHFQNRGIKDDFKAKLNQLTDWSKNEKEEIKYFSGTALYTTNFKWNKKDDKPVYIHFDDIKVMGTVKVNGVEMGTLWTAPYEIEITKALKTGDNKIEVEVANLWANRLLKDSKLPEEKRATWTLIDAVGDQKELMPSGIIGDCYLYTK